jgi:glycosyltransferase involved in cell wall biosynthesis
MVTCVQNSFSKYAGLMKVGDRVITGCQVVADDMTRRGVPLDKLRPILNGTIGSARQAPSDGDEFANPFQHPAIVTFCGMHWRKGVPDLIAGFQLARQTRPELNLYLFGEGPNLDEYRQLVNAENAAHITFCSPVPNAKPYLRAADAFVLASLADPAPLVICEAREAGLAVVATRVDGIPELLEDGRAGILVDARAPEQIAEKLIYLFSDPSHLRTWRENSQILIDRLEVRRVAEQSVEVYLEVIRTRPSSQRALLAE